MRGTFEKCASSMPSGGKPSCNRSNANLDLEWKLAVMPRACTLRSWCPTPGMTSKSRNALRSRNSGFGLSHLLTWARSEGKDLFSGSAAPIYAIFPKLCTGFAVWLRSWLNAAVVHSYRMRRGIHVGFCFWSIGPPEPVQIHDWHARTVAASEKVPAHVIGGDTPCAEMIEITNRGAGRGKHHSKPLRCIEPDRLSKSKRSKRESTTNDRTFRDAPDRGTSHNALRASPVLMR